MNKMASISQKPSGRRIAVIGAGCIGLSTALRLRQELPSEDDITIFGDELPPNTTGDSAAGLWMPVYFSRTKENKLWQWSKDTWDYLQAMIRTTTHQEKGVYYSPIYRFFTKPMTERPFWSDIVTTFRFLTREEVKEMVPCAESGLMATTLMVEGKGINEFLFKKFIASGGRCFHRKIFNFEELVNEGYDLIINCSGIGAKDLCQDNEVYPIRGQIHMLQAPWVRISMFLDDDYYILTNQDKVVCGGTHQVGDWDTTVRETDRRDIMTGVTKLIPSLINAPVLRDWVGLRPGRSELRLELEERRTNNGKRYQVVHNYGHGGSGLTIFWGCAGDALELAMSVLSKLPSSKL